MDNVVGRIYEYLIDVYDKIMNVDMCGIFLMMKMMLFLMMIKGGFIVNIFLFFG